MTLACGMPILDMREVDLDQDWFSRLATHYRVGLEHQIWGRQPFYSGDNMHIEPIRNLRFVAQIILIQEKQT